MYRANRLYNDTVHVFTEPLARDVKKNTYLALSIDARSKSKTVAVPSKLYYSQSVGKTLSGVRLGVEDNLDVAGTKNNNDKPAPHMLPATKANTMVAVKKLEDAGSELIGKTSSSPSSGAASHGTPYNWMDLTLGLDKASYIRSFAHRHGLFGNRFTPGLIDMKGISPASSSAFNALGLFAHDVKNWVAAGKVLSSSATYKSYRKAIYTVEGLTSSKSQAANNMINTFITGLEKQLGATNKVLNLQDEWTISKPKDMEADLAKMMNATYRALTAKKPKQADLQKAQNNQKEFYPWFEANVLKANKDSCSHSLFICAAGAQSKNAEIMYGHLSPLAGVPEAVFPRKQSLQLIALSILITDRPCLFFSRYDPIEIEETSRTVWEIPGSCELPPQLPYLHPQPLLSLSYQNT